MLVPNSQSGSNQMSSTQPIPANIVARRVARARAIQAAVADGDTRSKALLIANPWEDWKGGFNLMKDVQRGNQYNGAPAATSLPGLTSAQQILLYQVLGLRPQTAAPAATGWKSRFVTQANPPAATSSDPAAADVVPSDGILPADAAAIANAAPESSPLRTDQPGNVIVRPPWAPTRPARGGMGEWSPSIEQPGPAPADCPDAVAAANAVTEDAVTPGSGSTDNLPATRGDGASGIPGTPSSVPWWMWALGGFALLAAVTGGDDQSERRSSGKKRAA